MTLTHKPRMRILDVQMPGGKTVHVGIFRRFSGQALPFVEGLEAVQKFNEKHGTHLALVSRPVSKELLKIPANCDALMVCCSYPTSDFVGHARRGNILRSEIAYKSEFRLPRVVMLTKQHKGSDALLYVKGLTIADIQRDGRNWVIDVPEDRLVAVPISTETKDGEIQRSKIPPFTYVGPLFHNVWIKDYGAVYFEGGSVIRLWPISSPRNVFGVVVEIPELDMARIHVMRRSVHPREFAVWDVRSGVQDWITYVHVKSGGAFVTFESMPEWNQPNFGRTGTDSR